MCGIQVKYFTNQIYNSFWVKLDVGIKFGVDNTLYKLFTPRQNGSDACWQFMLPYAMI